jgi:hypothetical protein
MFPWENGTTLPRFRSLQVTDKPNQLLQRELPIPPRFVSTLHQKRHGSETLPERQLSTNVFNLVKRRQLLSVLSQIRSFVAA